MLDAALRAADTARVASQKNVELVQTVVDAVNRADADAFVACFHPDVEWEATGDRFPGFLGIYRGHAGVRRWFEEALEPWESVRVEQEELVEVSDDRLVGCVLMTTRGRGSGVETELRMWQVLWVADGRIARRRGPYSTRDEALEAVGRRE